MNKTNEFWRDVFEQLKLDTQYNLHLLNYTELNQLLDPKEVDRPAAFLAQHGYSVLPLSDRRLALVRAEFAHRLEKQANSEKFVSPLDFQLNTFATLNTPTYGLDKAIAYGLFDRLLGDTYYRSTSGVVETGLFSFEVAGMKLAANKVAVPIDLVLEGRNNAVLIKNIQAGQNSFNLQPLYYAYRHLRRLAKPKRILMCVFGYSSNQERYNFWLYSFTDLSKLDSLQLVGMNSYKQDDSDSDMTLPPAVPITKKHLLKV